MIISINRQKQDPKILKSLKKLPKNRPKICKNLPKILPKKVKSPKIGRTSSKTKTTPHSVSGDNIVLPTATRDFTYIYIKVR